MGNTSIATISNNLPSIDVEKRLIHGTGLKFVDGRWTAEGADMNGAELLALSMVQAAQRWRGREAETIIEYPENVQHDLDAMNAAIPQSEWEIGLNGEPRPPWERVRGVYLLNVHDASLFTYVNSTVGTRIALDRLKDRFVWMAAIRGVCNIVLPLVSLDHKPMKTRQGIKQRPEFTVVEWRNFSEAPGLGKAPLPAIGRAVKPVSVGEDLDDSIPF